MICPFFDKYTEMCVVEDDFCWKDEYNPETCDIYVKNKDKGDE